jgi:hypothetical protein
MAQYAVHNQAMEVVNVVEWDGVTKWHPGPGLSAVPVSDPSVGIGSTFVGGKWVRPAPPPRPEQEEPK